MDSLTIPPIEKNYLANYRVLTLCCQSPRQCLEEAADFVVDFVFAGDGFGDFGTQ